MAWAGCVQARVSFSRSLALPPSRLLESAVCSYLSAIFLSSPLLSHCCLTSAFLENWVHLGQHELVRMCIIDSSSISPWGRSEHQTPRLHTLSHTHTHSALTHSHTYTLTGFRVSHSLSHTHIHTHTHAHTQGITHTHTISHTSTHTYRRW